jgi:hypothetical protein
VKSDVTVDDRHDALHELCLRLFDTWCEKRSVIPLAYLMHVWPVSGSGADARSRVLCALGDLQKWHADALSQEEHRMIGRLLAQSA